MQAPPASAMFDPATYANVRRPLLEAETLLAWCYTSAAFYQRQVERVFHKTRNFIGSAGQIPIGTVHRATINRYASARSAGYWVEPASGQYVVTFAQHEGSMALLKDAAGFPRLRRCKAGGKARGPTRR